MRNDILLEVREDRVQGSFRVIDDGQPHRPVVALSGSEGGIPSYWADLLVPEGFACLAAAYFGYEGGRSGCVEIPVEVVAHAARWLLAHPLVESGDGTAALIGASKGGELALLAASSFPDLIGSTVAYVPSAFVWAGFDFADPTNMSRSSWSLNGEPLPFVPYGAAPPEFGERGMCTTPVYESGLDAAPEQAVIPIERARGPVLLVSGGQDGLWPSSRMSKMVVERAHAMGRPDLVRHLDYPDAGHVPLEKIPDIAPPGGLQFDLGGTREADIAAHRDAWPHVLELLRGTG